MRRIAIGIAILFVALPIFAGRKRSALWRVGGSPVILTAVELSKDPAFAGQLMNQVRAAHPTAVINNSSSRSFVIPAAGSVRGAGNTFFRSDITLANWNETPQDVAVLWLPNGGTAITYATTFPGDRPPFTIQDFVGTVLNQSGLGALVFLPITSAGAFDPNGAIDGFSRIWTPQPNVAGTVSQPFTGVDPNHLKGEYEAFILGLRQDASYRTNFGIVNLFNTPLKFVMTVFPESAPAGTQLAEVSVTIPAMSMVQQGLGSGPYSTPVNLAVNVDEDVPNDDQIWTAYASSTDNITGDGWVSIATKDLGDEDLDSLAHKKKSDQ
jgi:hypothetical protein